MTIRAELKKENHKEKRKELPSDEAAVRAERARVYAVLAVLGSCTPWDPALHATHEASAKRARRCGMTMLTKISQSGDGERLDRPPLRTNVGRISLQQ